MNTQTNTQQTKRNYFGDKDQQATRIAQSFQKLITRANDLYEAKKAQIELGEEIEQSVNNKINEAKIKEVLASIAARQQIAINKCFKNIDKFYGNNNKYKPRKDTPKGMR